MSSRTQPTDTDEPTTPTPRTALRDASLAGLSDDLGPEQVDAIEAFALDSVDRTALLTDPLPDWYARQAIRGGA